MTQGRARPAGRAEEDEEGIDDAEGGSRRTADQRTPDSKNDRRAEVFGDKSVIHGLKGKLSNRRLEDKVRKQTLEVLSDQRCHEFGPTYANFRMATPNRTFLLC